MIVLLAALAVQTAPAAPTTQAGPPAPAADRYQHCIAVLADDAVAAEREATRWATQDGKAPASRCLGLALVKQARFAPAADAFEAAAKADASADPLASAEALAQAGNAWLAAGDAAKARVALDAALAAKRLTGLQLGEAHLDRARALVAAQQLAAARVDLDAALQTAGQDPLAWLLSATLARRMQDLPRAKTDIAEALRLAADAPQVHLEAGNIAAASGDEAGARKAWTDTVALAPNSPEAQSATRALAQFGPAAVPKAPEGR